MNFYVSDISFDFSDSRYELSQNEKIDIIDDSLGLWRANSDEELINEITESVGYCVNSIQYEVA
jgi:hypothetical protein|tara:strand:- start:2390 stop:2581 length:192 start_codon:yes stop_codon:yes gene_type:complete